MASGSDWDEPLLPNAAKTDVREGGGSKLPLTDAEERGLLGPVGIDVSLGSNKRTAWLTVLGRRLLAFEAWHCRLLP